MFTFGIYWFYWTLNAYKEIADHEEKKNPHQLWILSVAAYVVMIAVAFRAGYFGSDFPARLPTESLAEQTRPILLADAVATAAFFGTQLAYLWSASRAPNDALRAFGEPLPSTAFLVLFSVLLGTQGVPKIGFIAALIGGTLSIVWQVQTQLTMNLYWKEVEARQWVPRTGSTGTTQPRPVEA